MTPSPPSGCFRFGIFEADGATGELRRAGVRVKLHAQPFQVLWLLLERPGELLTREEIARQLWPDGTFVDLDHGVHSAVNRIREALGDRARSPRFVETLPRRGYRFVAPVERIGSNSSAETAAPHAAELANQVAGSPPIAARSRGGVLARPEDLPQLPYQVVQTLFIGLQAMYLAFYVGALANLPEIEDLLSLLPHAHRIFLLILITAAVLIPARAYVLTAALLHPPGGRDKLLMLWRGLVLFDELWALAPFLLLHHINFGFALACAAPLVYAPFAARSLVLMGAGGSRSAT